MSSPKSAAARVARAKAPARVRPKAGGKSAVTTLASSSDRSIEAIRLAADIERSIADGQLNVLSTQARQALLAATCKIYAAQVEKGGDAAAFGARTIVSPTEVMVTASGLLKTANLAAYELGLWQSWTGR